MNSSRLKGFLFWQTFGSDFHPWPEIEELHQIRCQRCWKNGCIILSLKKVSNAIVYLYKSKIRPKMEYCCHIRVGAAQSTLSCLKVQSQLQNLVGDDIFSFLQLLSYRRDIASLSLFYHYFHSKCSFELQSRAPPNSSTFHKKHSPSWNDYKEFLSIFICAWI